MKQGRTEKREVAAQPRHTFKSLGLFLAFDMLKPPTKKKSCVEQYPTKLYNVAISERHLRFINQTNVK